LIHNIDRKHHRANANKARMYTKLVASCYCFQFTMWTETVWQQYTAPNTTQLTKDDKPTAIKTYLHRVIKHADRC